jgi:hypothetical protein
VVADFAVWLPELLVAPAEKLELVVYPIEVAEREVAMEPSIFSLEC